MATDNTAAEKRDQLRRAWARDKLHATGDRVDDARDAFWKVLVASQGTPPGEQRLAYRVLADSTVWSGDASSVIPPVVIAAADVAVEAQLFAAIEQFAAEFFSLAPAERRERFKTLQDDAACFPRLDRRLSEFAPVLDAEPVKNAAEHPRELELATWLEKLCVAPPSQRGALRCQAWKALQENHSDWSKVVNLLRQMDPSSISCDPSFVEVLEQTSSRRAKTERNRADRAAQTSRSAIVISNGAELSTRESILVFLLVSICMGGFIAVSAPSTSKNLNPPNPYYTPLTYSFPKTPPMPDFPYRINRDTGKREIDTSQLGPAIRSLMGYPPPTESELQEMPPHIQREFRSLAEQQKLEEKRKELQRLKAIP